MSSSTPPVLDPIHPQYLSVLDQDFIDYWNSSLGTRPKASLFDIDFADLRANPKKYEAPWCKDFSDLPYVTDQMVSTADGHEIPVRVYSPDEERFGKGPFPVHVNYHGGGYCLGGLTTDAEWCMLVRNELGIVVVDVDYRMAPEHPITKCFEDGWTALQWVHSNAARLNALPDSISISGISAGACISAVVQHLARDAHLNLKLAILTVLPAGSHGRLQSPSDSPFPSMQENAHAPGLDFERIQFFSAITDKSLIREVNPDGTVVKVDLPRGWACPLELESFGGLCDTFVGTAGCDPLRDEGELYGQKLVEAGVRVIMRRYTGVPHSFMHMPLEKAAMYNRDTCDILRSAHRR